MQERNRHARATGHLQVRGPAGRRKYLASWTDRDGAHRTPPRPGARHRPMTRLLTADEVAARLGVPKSWVWARARADETPCVRLGRYRRFREDPVDAWEHATRLESPRRG